MTPTKTHFVQQVAMRYVLSHEEPTGKGETGLKREDVFQLLNGGRFSMYAFRHQVTWIRLSCQQTPTMKQRPNVSVALQHSDTHNKTTLRKVFNSPPFQISLGKIFFHIVDHVPYLAQIIHLGHADKAEHLQLQCVRCFHPELDKVSGACSCFKHSNRVSIVCQRFWLSINKLTKRSAQWHVRQRPTQECAKKNFGVA